MENTTYKKVKVKTWYLRFNGEKPVNIDTCRFHHWLDPDSERYLRLYKAVGDKWGWTGRLLLSEKELNEKLHSTENEIWLFQPKETAIGFFEIDFSEEGKAEIVYLGLIPGEVGKGYGKEFLNTAIAVAGRKGDEVWLHTCEFDHPKVLNTYLKAGFEIVQEKIDEESYSSDFLKKHQLSGKY